MTKPILKVFFHNINYDVPQMIRNFVKNRGLRADVKCIPKSKEKFMTLTKKLDLGEEVVLDKNTGKKKVTKFWFNIQIVDSLSFLGGSLEKVVSSLPKTEFKHLEGEVSKGDQVEFELFTQKGIFPYSYITDGSKLKEGCPSIEKCFDVLGNKKMKKEDHQRMTRAYEILECNDLEDYGWWYLKTDCILLADAFEFYRKTNMEQEGLDPTFYISLAQLAYDSMLKLTKVELELFPPDQADMHTAFNTSRRGGLIMCPHRYAKANNKYMKDYDPSKPSSFIIYMDVVGMYSSVQLEDLPVSGFTYMTEKEVRNWEDIFNREGERCFLVVDLDYPLELHNEHNSFALCPDHLDGRLDAHPWDGRNYGIYYQGLKFVIEKA